MVIVGEIHSCKHDLPEAFSFQSLHSFHHFIPIKPPAFTSGDGGTAVAAGVVTTILDLEIGPGMVGKGLGVEIEGTPLLFREASHAVESIHTKKS